MRVYIVQHGQAKSKDADPDRHLTDKGARDVQKVTGLLRPLGLKVEQIRHSGKARARQTAEILSAGLSTVSGVVQCDGLGPTDPVEKTVEELNGASEDLMIVGHLPFMSKLAGALLASAAAGEPIAFQQGGVVCLQKNDDSSWRVRWMVVPGIIS